MRAEHAAALKTAGALTSASVYSGPWSPLGPAPLTSDATGNGTQDYGTVAGRATAIAIDPADPTGNTIYIGGAQAGVWKSSNAADFAAGGVTWTPLTDDQATLSIGALAIQPGNNDPAKSVVLAATGEANNSSDCYFGSGFLRSTDSGNTWTSVSTANGGTLSLSGLGGTRIAFSTAMPNTVVAAMATSSEGVIAGAISANTRRGLYTSLDAGQTWNYDALLDSGAATDATSATSVVFNSGKFFAAVRYHGFYSSPDGVTWTRLAAQPGGLSASACPPQSETNGQACPIYRGEITTVPGRNEMYAWFIYFSASGSITDGGIWQSLNGGASWSAISDAGITVCGDSIGCGVEQGSYNLELLAVPNLTGTDLYAGSINLYKCSINSQNTSCAAAPFLNLTHVYGCDPIAAPAHVHPDQHALAYAIPSSGSDAGNALLYFANDGGIYRALNGYSGLTSGSCSGPNQFDDLNQNLGSMTQFVAFSQHPSDPDTLLGGTQDNGSPATASATVSLGWGNVLGGDGGYDAIDPNVPTNFFASNPDIPPGGLQIQQCGSGVHCTDNEFSPVVLSAALNGDDGAFYFPYILDPQSTSALLVGTCRIWRGPRGGGSYVALSPNFETLGSGTCSGSEVNQVRAIATGGPTDSYGSTVIYAATSGLGPLDGPLYSPVGGRIWVTTNATAGPSSFTDVTSNGPQGNINPNQFPISAVALDSSDPSGATAYITVMGFTGGPGHVWKTTNAGQSWTDFTAALPDSPANAVVVDSAAAQVYVGTDVGVFTSSTFSPQWTEVGPAPAPTNTGFLPNVAVTALALFKSGGLQLLRASTYGRGIWQFNLNSTPDYQLAVSSSPLTGFVGQNVVFNGTATALGGYSNSVTMRCTAGATPPPSTCTVNPAVLTPKSNTPFTVTAAGAVGDYSFNVQGVGADPQQITHQAAVTLHVVGFGMTTPTPASVSVARGSTSPAVSFQVTAAGSFNQSVTLSCSVSVPNATCNFSPSATVNPTSNSAVNVTMTVTVPAGATSGSYPVTINASTAGAPAAATAQFTLQVTANPDFSLTSPSPFPEVNAGSTGTKGTISIASLDGFSGAVSLSCTTTAGAGTCSVSPASVSSYPATAYLTINAASLAAGSYSASLTGVAGALTHAISIPFVVGDYAISGTQSLTAPPSGQAAAHVTLTSVSSYAGKINATCDASALASAVCTLSPPNPINLASGGSTNVTVTVNVPTDAATGNYNIKVNTQDTSGAPSHSFTIALTIAQDFLVISSTPSQTVSPGQTTGPYNLSIQPVGGSFNQAVSLSCSGLPAGAQCSFNPPSALTPGSSAVDVIMNISTTGGSDLRLRASRLSGLYAVWMLGPGLILIWVVSRSAKGIPVSSKAASLLVLMVCALWISCGGASTGGGGGGSNCPAAPNVPTGLATSGTTSTTTTLNWTASTAPVGCSVSYVISETTPSNKQIGTSSTPTYNVAGLSPATQYGFAVAASDSAGSSAATAPVSVTTTSTGGTPKGSYTITVTGSAAGTPADAGQSTQVTLIVQ